MAEDGLAVRAPVITGMMEQERDEEYVDEGSAEEARVLHGVDEHGDNLDPGQDPKVLVQVSDPSTMQDDDAGLGSVLDMCWCHEHPHEDGADGSALRLVALVIRYGSGHF